MTTQMIISSVCPSRYQDLLEKKKFNFKHRTPVFVRTCMGTHTDTHTHRHTHTTMKSPLPFAKICFVGSCILINEFILKKCIKTMRCHFSTTKLANI